MKLSELRALFKRPRKPTSPKVERNGWPIHSSGVPGPGPDEEKLGELRERFRRPKAEGPKREARHTVFWNKRNILNWEAECGSASFAVNVILTKEWWEYSLKANVIRLEFLDKSDVEHIVGGPPAMRPSVKMQIHDPRDHIWESEPGKVEVFICTKDLFPDHEAQ